MIDVGLTAALVRAPDVLAVHVGETMVLHDPRSDRYVSLNGSGELLWELLSSARSVQELTDALGQRYGIPATQARQDVERLVGDLLERGMLQLG